MRSFKTRIATETLYWTNLTSSIRELPYIVKKSGYDFVVIDGLNGEFSSMSTVCETVQRCNDVDLPCIYRSNVNADLVRALDQGAAGVACMNLRTADDVEQLSYQLKFYPEGQRRPNPFTPLGHFGIDDFSLLKKQSNEEIVVWAFIEENVATVNNIDQILNTQKIDIAYLGHAVSKKNHNSIELAKHFKASCAENNIAVAGFHYGMGSAKYDQADALKFSIQSPSIIGISTDMHLIYRGLTSGLTDLKAFNLEHGAQFHL